jgi:hypothetical protein
MLSEPATGAIIQINDLTDIVTATDNGTSNGRFSTNPNSCASNEECIFTILAPAGTVSTHFSTTIVNIFDDQSMTTVSETLQQTTCTVTQVANCWQFDSDREAPLSVIPGGTSMVENGLFQTAITVSYLNIDNASIGNDSITFQSDIDGTGTPEPSTLAIVMSGLAFVGVWLRRHRSAIRTR